MRPGGVYETRGDSGYLFDVSHIMEKKKGKKIWI
jgi:hypothetical protein